MYLGFFSHNKRVGFLPALSLFCLQSLSFPVEAQNILRADPWLQNPFLLVLPCALRKKNTCHSDLMGGLDQQHPKIIVMSPTEQQWYLRNCDMVCFASGGSLSAVSSSGANFCFWDGCCEKTTVSHGTLSKAGS